MIPKKLHYVWVGGAPIPPKYQAYIDRWSELMPDWQVVRWDETNFDIERSSDYCRQAFEARRWAFVSDYIRVKVLYEHGGIYLDTDEEMIQPLDRFAVHKAFFGLEAGPRMQAGVFGCRQGNPLIGAILQRYDNISYEQEGKQNNTVVGTHFFEVIKQHAPVVELKEVVQELGDGVVLYPSQYFCPDLATLRITDESYTIHRPMGSWLSPSAQLKKRIYVAAIKIKPINWLYRKIKR